MDRAWAPSIAPDGHDDTVYLLVDCYGKAGRVWCEAPVAEAGLETVIIFGIG
jgi:hypothetical protein